MSDNNGVQYTNPPQSRNEAILESMLTGEPYNDPPQSRIEDLLIQIKEKGIGGGITEAVKTALLACFANVAWANANGQTYYNALEAALNASEPELSSISASLQGTYTTDNTISDVTSHITVTAIYSDSSTSEVTPFAVFDTSDVDMNTPGNYTIGVSYTEEDITKTTTVSLTVSSAIKELTSISASLSGTYTTDDTISDVTSNISVTATYSDTTTADVTASAVFDTTQVDMSTAGTYSIGVSYTEDGITKTTTVTLVVNTPGGGTIDNWSLTAGKTWNNSTGAISTGQDYEGVSDFLAVDPNTSYTISFAPGFTDNANRPGVSVCEYSAADDSTKTAGHRGCLGGTTYSTFTFTTNASTHYIIVYMNAQYVVSKLAEADETTVPIVKNVSP